MGVQFSTENESTFEFQITEGKHEIESDVEKW